MRDRAQPNTITAQFVVIAEGFCPSAVGGVRGAVIVIGMLAAQSPLGMSESGGRQCLIRSFHDDWEKMRVILSEAPGTRVFRHLFAPDQQRRTSEPIISKWSSNYGHVEYLVMPFGMANCDGDICGVAGEERMVTCDLKQRETKIG